MSAPTIPAHEWSISYTQLMDFDKKASKNNDYSNMTLRDINTTIIEPSCRKTGSSYALMLNPNGLPVEAFITHCWDESFKEFVCSIRRAFECLVTKPNLWICAFALRQGCPQTVKSQLDMPLEESPFVQAIEKATTFVVVRNSAADLYSRIWCVCELMYAHKYNLVPNDTLVTGPDAFPDLDTSCLDAKAAIREDREKILKTLLNEHDVEKIDQLVDLFRKKRLTDESTRLIRDGPSSGENTGTRFLYNIITRLLGSRDSDIPDMSISSDSDGEPETLETIGMSFNRLGSERYTENTVWVEAVEREKKGIHSLLNELSHYCKLEGEHTKIEIERFARNGVEKAILHFDFKIVPGTSLKSSNKKIVQRLMKNLEELIKDALRTLHDESDIKDILDRVKICAYGFGSIYVLLDAPYEYLSTLFTIFVEESHSLEESLFFGKSGEFALRHISPVFESLLTKV